MSKRLHTIAVITGDIVNSREITNASKWLIPFKKVLSKEGESPKTWEIYRGDSFQVEIKNPATAFLTAVRLKATVKCNKHLDVRIAIGVGTKSFSASRVTESNGEAFVNSGEKLENMKREKQHLAIKTPWTDFDKEMNLYFKLASIVMDNWTTGAAELVRILIDNQEITQGRLAELLKISQSSVSERKKRAYYAEIMELENAFHSRIKNLIP